MTRDHQHNPDPNANAARIVGVVSGVLLTMFLAFVGTVYMLGESKVREIARSVVREELEFRNTVVQQGRFTAKNKVADSPLTFEWPLQKPVDPDGLIGLIAEPLTVTPGIAISSVLGEDGKTCRMIVYGEPDTIANLQLPIDAKVTITERQ